MKTTHIPETGLECLGLAIGAMREAAHQSQDDLARLAGVSQSTWSRYERGQGVPDIVTLWRTGLDLADLRTRTEALAHAHGLTFDLGLDARPPQPASEPANEDRTPTTP